MLDLDAIDVAKIAGALADQTDYEHRWLIGPRTGELAFWTSDLGIDGEDPVELDELDLILIDPLPSNVWYQDMVDFGDGISDRGAGERQSRSLEGKGAFRRFKNQLYQRHPELIADWHALRDARATVRAVPWLADEGLIEEDAAERFSDTTARPPAVTPRGAESGHIREGRPCVSAPPDARVGGVDMRWMTTVASSPHGTCRNTIGHRHAVRDDPLLQALRGPDAIVAGVMFQLGPPEQFQDGGDVVGESAAVALA